MEDNKVKVLYFVDRMLRGGIQSLVIDWVSRLDKNKIQVDFLLLDDGNTYEMEDELRNIGCNIYKLDGIWVNSPLDYIKYNKAMNNFFKIHNDYNAIHMHGTSKNYGVLKYAQKYGIKIRISHSHNIGFQTKNKLKIIVGNIMKRKLIKYSTDYFACSELAGRWLFGEKIVKSDKFKIIHNAIDYNKFRYNNTLRNNIRKQLEIDDDTIVIGNIARFENQKNHYFLIDIFKEYNKKNNNSVLVLIGEGSLEKKIKDKCLNLGIVDKVKFLGFKKNANEYFNIMDYFVLPSLYEGLGLVLIEAQANGLTCFTSKDVVPLEAKITDKLIYISLKNNAIEWANKILTNKNERIDTFNDLKSKKYLINDIILELEKKYKN